MKEEEEEEPGLDEYGAAKGSRRGGTTRRGRTTRRGLSRYRQTQRKTRDTVRTNRGASQLLQEGIALEEVTPKPE